MPSLLTLIPDVIKSKPPHNDNHLRIPKLFATAGWQVTTAPQERLHMTKGQVLIENCLLEDFDLIWHLGLGKQSTFMDRMQMLTVYPNNNFVTQPHALQNLHSKISFQEFGPETYLFNHYTQISQVLTAPGKWVIKPTAASFADDVVFIETPAKDIHTRIDRATNHGERYCLLQKYIEQAATGETRCLMAGKNIIGCYRRVTQPDQQQSVHSLDKGAQAQPWQLTKREEVLATQITKQLNAGGIAFAAIDLVEPYLMEVNVANPGGLATLENLGDLSAAEALVEQIAGYCLPNI